MTQKQIRVQVSDHVEFYGDNANRNLVESWIMELTIRLQELKNWPDDKG